MGIPIQAGRGNHERAALEPQTLVGGSGHDGLPATACQGDSFESVGAGVSLLPRCEAMDAASRRYLLAAGNKQTPPETPADRQYRAAQALEAKAHLDMPPQQSRLPTGELQVQLSLENLTPAESPMDGRLAQALLWQEVATAYAQAVALSDTASGQGSVWRSEAQKRMETALEQEIELREALLADSIVASGDGPSAAQWIEQAQHYEAMGSAYMQLDPHGPNSSAFTQFFRAGEAYWASYQALGNHKSSDAGTATLKRAVHALRQAYSLRSPTTPVLPFVTTFGEVVKAWAEADHPQELAILPPIKDATEFAVASAKAQALGEARMALAELPSLSDRAANTLIMLISPLLREQREQLEAYALATSPSGSRVQKAAASRPSGSARLPSENGSLAATSPGPSGPSVEIQAMVAGLPAEPPSNASERVTGFLAALERNGSLTSADITAALTGSVRSPLWVKQGVLQQLVGRPGGAELASGVKAALELEVGASAAPVTNPAVVRARLVVP